MNKKNGFDFSVLTSGKSVDNMHWADKFQVQQAAIQKIRSQFPDDVKWKLINSGLSLKHQFLPAIIEEMEQLASTELDNIEVALVKDIKEDFLMVGEFSIHKSILEDWIERKEAEYKEMPAVYRDALFEVATVFRALETIF